MQPPRWHPRVPVVHSSPSHPGRRSEPSRPLSSVLLLRHWSSANHLPLSPVAPPCPGGQGCPNLPLQAPSHSRTQCGASHGGLTLAPQDLAPALVASRTGPRACPLLPSAGVLKSSKGKLGRGGAEALHGACRGPAPPAPPGPAPLSRPRQVSVKAELNSTSDAASPWGRTRGPGGCSPRTCLAFEFVSWYQSLLGTFIP